MFFWCDYCNYDCKTKQIFYKHINTKNHKYAVQNKYINLQVIKCSICQAQVSEKSTVCTGIESPAQCNATASTLNSSIPLAALRVGGTYVSYNASDDSHLKEPYKEPLKGLDINVNISDTNCTDIESSDKRNVNVKKKFVLSAFGYEDLSFMTDELEFSIICNSVNPFELLVNNVYSHRTNLNIYISDKQNKLVKYLLPNNTVKVDQLSEVLEILTNKYKNILNLGIDKFINNVDDVQKNYLLRLKREHISGSCDNTYKKILKGKMFVFGERSKSFLVNPYFLAENRPDDYLK